MLYHIWSLISLSLSLFLSFSLSLFLFLSYDHQVLVLGNKRDLPNALDEKQLIEKM